MMRIHAALFITISTLFATTPSIGQTVTSPQEHLGRPLGTDFELADWDQVRTYYELLGEQSPRVLTETVGETTEGREFLISVVTSEENLADLDAIKRRAAMIADPRGATVEQMEDAVANGKAILFVACSMHSTETAGTEFGMGLAHTLATSDDEPWASARRELVTVIIPTVNPDGLDHVVSWYRKHVGSEFEGGRMLKLYQYYAGHDNNRDWFMLSQAETRIVTRLLYHEWFPTVYWDVHQQGSSEERFFVPPYRDPLNPNLDPMVITAIDALGSRALHDMTLERLTGISTGVTYDMWWNGGNRNVPVRHNIVGILTEAASVNIASPIFLEPGSIRPPGDLEAYAPSNRFPDPWPGGWWRLKDIHRYEMAFARSLMGSLSRERQFWLEGALASAIRTMDWSVREGPRAWVIPSDNRDPDATRRLMDAVLLAGVDVHVADGPVEADGRTYPEGSIVILSDQPYARHVKDLFEVQRYPEGPPPYDVSGWTLPELLGVRRVEVQQSITGDFRFVEDADEAVAAFAGDSRLEAGQMSLHHSGTWSILADALEAGESFEFDDGLLKPAEGRDVDLSAMPRIGIYAPWFGSMDEGWLRFAFDYLDVPFVPVRNEMLRAGELGEFLDVLVIASMSPRSLDRGRSPGTVPAEYTRGFEPEGSIAIEQFVNAGGTLVTLGSSSDWAIDQFGLPIVDVTGDDDFSCPGSVVRVVPQDGRWMNDLPGSVGVFFSRSSAYREMGSSEREKVGARAHALTVRLRYAPTNVLISGWMRDPHVIADKAAWVSASVGEGRVEIFGFRPQYRGWSQVGFGLLMRAAFLEPAARLRIAAVGSGASRQGGDTN